ncbi:MAG: hypothetical protein UU40_C0004G0024 [Candidatus Uhrbacteria bacterium GW2011_GWD2_41_121]|uniref:Baseplate protein J-like domain-containing protein n=1 Tax=Candidatus Uhrbacteria bacterium GW2011_GWC1_41_20 TaxID=1618983 RepID=A0A0G0VFS6_9BACT|nr:MAG: hypothetical protein UT52_C0006G0024 [Candidatus Uhrbacteria bacterium GW2011_GWE1_39_46]KKR64234.1 MAG: hypothetical protein UU04_C0004G0024 [Candidatus Uhrbacteria bacterium GW2011_GWC2_40_450]KKR90367.1 MAG: hypothetical protein UU40_C0004G0024 [Candidatus Uhrbacteria bacterium GW2011_GWD2_41_121]KKR96270.1 MAG: hypothetical protein UU46_C0005G0024 [Candidatus Uhrbacteria bacterium GW2011_GWD1_41_16]KKR99643.1 MAG: hypothetical protein UU50_C0004G0024 [Candidatus Uhrbacteria bacteriu
MTAKTSGNKPLSRSLRIYQKIAVAFVIVSFILLLFVLYLSVSSATIKITPVPQVVSTTVSVDIVPSATMEGQVSGYVVSQIFTQADTFYLPAEGATPVEQKAGGVVTLINETTNNQQLVEKTRVLSKEGILFRLDEGVTVPAGGQIDAMVHADELGLLGEIGPTQFTIPGLALSLQDQIYAVSIDSMVGGVSYTRVLQESDLNDAAVSLANSILAGAKETLDQLVENKEFDGVEYSITEIERVANQEPGAEVGSFNISLTLEITAVYYDKSIIEEYTTADLQLRISENYDLDQVSEDGVQVEIRSVDLDKQEASLSVYLDGTAVISPSSDVLNKDRLVGRSPAEVITILEASELIDKVSVEFTPFWLKRVPTLKDHIKINIE